MMIFSQVWQQLMFLSMQPMAWVISPPQAASSTPVPVKTRSSPRRPKAKRR